MDASAASYGGDTALRRDGKVIGLIATVHMASHMYQIALPALFPLINRAEGLSFTQLGILTTVFFLVSGLTQTPAGFLVDRVGARPVLIGGLVLMSTATALYGLAPSYPVMVLLAFLAGLGNSIFHPADISILTGSVSQKRMGRAFSIHYFGGFIGYAATPVIMVALAAWLGWRAAIFAIGAAGLIAAGVAWSQRRDLRDDRDAGRESGRSIVPVGLRKEIGILFQAPTILSFVFFAFMAMGSVGMMQFGASTLMALVGMETAMASTAIAVNLTGAVIGILIGGWIADHSKRHDAIAALTVSACVALLLIIPTARPDVAWTLLPIMIGAGIFYGISCPLRDMLIRSMAPKGAAGKIFGFTYSGMDFGSSVSGVAIGLLLDHGMPAMVFVGVALCMVVAVIAILIAKVLSHRAAAVAA